MFTLPAGRDVIICHVNHDIVNASHVNIRCRDTCIIITVATVLSTVGKDTKRCVDTQFMMS